MKKTVLIVGASLAGARAAETLRAEGFDGRVIVVGDELHLPYERPPLSKEVLRGDKPVDVAFVHPEAWYADNDVELLLGTRAHMVDPIGQTVMAGGALVSYNALLLCTGGRPRDLMIEGVTLPGVHVMRTIDDSAAIREALVPGARIVIIGAGFIGAEVATTAKALGCEVTVLEVAAVPLARALGEEMGQVIAQIARDAGIDLRTGVSIARIEGDTRARRVVLEDGTAFEADAIVVGVGLEPNDEIALDAGIACNNGILVDERLMSDARGVFAAGDVANAPNAVIGTRVRVEHWQNAQNQGVFAARAILGKPGVWGEVPWFWSDQYGVTVQLAGHPARWDEIVIRGDVETRDFSAWYMDAGVVVASLGVNRSRDVRAGKTLIESRARIEPAVLRDPDTDLRALAKTVSA